MSCGAPPKSALARAAASVVMLATSTATAMTLMACYGMPPCDNPEDKDGDGFATCSDEEPEDCDDTNADIYYGAPDEEGDGIDQNCDGVDGIASETGGGGGGTAGAPAGGAPAGGAPAGGAPAGGAPAGGAGGAG